MAAVLVDKLSGNGLLHDLLHLQDTQGWERLIGRGAVPQGLCCTPRVSPQAVWGVWVAPRRPFSFHGLLVPGRSVADSYTLPISLHWQGGLSPLRHTEWPPLPTVPLTVLVPPPRRILRRTHLL